MLIIIMLCVLSFVLGQKFSNVKLVAPPSNEKYKKLPDSYEEDEEVLPNPEKILNRLKECLPLDGDPRNHAEEPEGTSKRG